MHAVGLTRCAAARARARARARPARGRGAHRSWPSVCARRARRAKPPRRRRRRRTGGVSTTTICMPRVWPAPGRDGAREAARGRRPTARTRAGRLDQLADGVVVLRARVLELLPLDVDRPAGEEVVAAAVVEVQVCDDDDVDAGEVEGLLAQWTEAGVKIGHRRVQLSSCRFDQHPGVRMVDDVHVDRYPLALGDRSATSSCVIVGGVITSRPRTDGSLRREAGLGSHQSMPSLSTSSLFDRLHRSRSERRERRRRHPELRRDRLRTRHRQDCSSVGSATGIRVVRPDEPVDHSAARAGRAGSPRREAERRRRIAHSAGNVCATSREPRVVATDIDCRKDLRRPRRNASMSVGDPPERPDVPAGALIHVVPARRAGHEPRHRRARPLRLRITARGRARRAPRLGREASGCSNTGRCHALAYSRTGPLVA